MRYVRGWQHSLHLGSFWTILFWLFGPILWPTPVVGITPSVTVPTMSVGRGCNVLGDMYMGQAGDSHASHRMCWFTYALGLLLLHSLPC